MLGTQVESKTPAKWCRGPQHGSADRREYRRIKIDFEGFVRINGQRLRVGGVDAHRAGARVTAGQAVPAGSLVLFRVDAADFAAWASVRSCEPVGHCRYEIGLEFLVPKPAPVIPSPDGQPWK